MRTEIIEAIENLRENRSDSVDQALIQLQGAILSFSMKVCGNREDAEDTMQETLLQAAPRLSHFDRAEALAVWLYKVAKTRCLMSRRRSKFAPVHTLSLESLMQSHGDVAGLSNCAGSTPEEQVLRSERHEALQKAVLKLPPQYRLPLVLHDMEELSTEETATVLGIREGTVRVRLHRARLFLRNELERTSGPRLALQKEPRILSRRCRTLIAALSEYLDERLDGTLCSELEKHVDGCPACRRLLSELERTIKHCRLHQPVGQLRPSARTRQVLLAEYRRVLYSLRNAT